MTTNHKILPAFDITLAALNGTTIEAFCGDVFVPTVIPGTSGAFRDPTGNECEACDESRAITREWNRLRRERNRMVREMRVIEKAYRSAHKEWRAERERGTKHAPKREGVNA